MDDNNKLRYPETENDLSYKRFLSKALKNPEEKESVDYNDLSFVEKVLLEKERRGHGNPGRAL